MTRKKTRRASRPCRPRRAPGRDRGSARSPRPRARRTAAPARLGPTRTTRLWSRPSEAARIRSQARPRPRHRERREQDGGPEGRRPGPARARAPPCRSGAPAARPAADQAVDRRAGTADRSRVRVPPGEKPAGGKDRIAVGLNETATTTTVGSVMKATRPERERGVTAAGADATRSSSQQASVTTSASRANAPRPAS